MNVEDLMNQMLNLFDNTSRELQSAKDKLSFIDTQLSDLDHYLEIHTLKSYELAKLGKLRKDLREKRRQIKYDIEMISCVKKFTDKYNNKLITGDIIQNLKEQKSILERQSNPTYIYRTNILERLKTNESTNTSETN